MGEPPVHTRAPCVDFLAADALAKHTLVERLARSWSLAPADSAGLTIVDEEQVAIAEVRLNPHCFMLFTFALPCLTMSRLFQALARALKLARSRSSISNLEGQIRNLQRSDTLLRGQICDLQAQCQKSNEAATAYKRRLKKLKKEKEALDAEKKDLEH